MKYRFTNTRLRPVVVTIWDNPAEEQNPKQYAPIRYDGVAFWELVTEKDAQELEAETDGSCIDPNHEYITLHFRSGALATFRYSFCSIKLLQ